MVPKLMYHGEQLFGHLEILQGFPRHRRLLNIWPRLSSGLMVLLLVVVFAMWLSPSYARSTTMHAIGSAYGAMLVFDAVFVWITGIRPIIGLRQRYVVVSARTWRSHLQVILALAYIAVPIVFLLGSS